MSENIRRFIRRVLFLLACFSAIGLHIQAAERTRAVQGSSLLAAGFHNPPADARPMAYWCWLDGCVRPEYFARELALYRDAGINGLYIFDVGVKDPDDKIPAGPTFLGPESVSAMARAIRAAGKLDMEMGIIVSSSWNAGGPWVRPEHAAMGLYRAILEQQGPKRFSGQLPFPSIPKAAPRNADGTPCFYRDIGVLAIPEQHRLGGHEFIFKLPDRAFTVDRVVLYNTLSGDQKRYGPMHLFAKDFAVALSTTDTDSDSFVEAVRGTLKPSTEAQSFSFEARPARYVKLLISSGYNDKSDRVELGEFELYSTSGRNVVSAYAADGSRTGATLLSCSSALGGENESDWTAANIHDRATSGPGGSWSSAGPPPLVIHDVDSIVDLTDRITTAGKLTWDVPAGKWEIHRFVCANTGQQLAIPSPNSQGLAIDHFNPIATEMHFRTVLDRLRKAVGPFAATALKYAYVCSYELRGAAWTPKMLDEFRRRRGYAMRRWLPTLFGSIVRSPEYTARFRYDYRKTLGDLIVDAFYRKAREISNAYGLLLCAEAGGPGPPLHPVPVDALKALGAVDIPRGEFWNAHNVWVVKETACAAHIYAKSFVDMEAFTSWRHWQDGPFELKPLADRALCGGTNHFTFHTGSHSPPEGGVPGWVYHAGTHMNPRLVWWPMARAFTGYLARSSFLLQQGVPVSDVCYYYGRQAFNFVGPKHVDPALGYGFDYDVTNAEVLLNRMQVRENRIVLPNGVRYELLVLPNRDRMDWEVLQRLEQLVAAGATIVGPRPEYARGLTGYPERDAAVRKIADRVWGPCDGKQVTEHAYGKGHVFWGREPRAILQARAVVTDFDFVSQDGNTRLDYIHRRVRETDIYFVRNESDRPESVTCTFRVHDRSPELWDPATGDMRAQLVYQVTRDGTRVPLELDPYGSVFVVFRQPVSEKHVARVAIDEHVVFPRAPSDSTPRVTPQVTLDSVSGSLILAARTPGRYTLDLADGQRKMAVVGTVPAALPIQGPWQVTFDAAQVDHPDMTFPQLISWTDHPRDAIKFFSGIARYRRTFTLPPAAIAKDRPLVLDLGRVRFVADVWLNGKHVGILWKPPFAADISGIAKSGENELVVRVANVWSNRLTGDARQPNAKPFCNTNMKYALSWEMPWKDAPLHESGLLGPVRIRSARRVVLP